MTEIECMLLEEIDYSPEVFDKYKDWIWQEKYNGVRGIVHVKNKKITAIRGRSNAPLLFNYPELREIEFPFNEAILDCEIVVLKDDKSVFYGGIDQRRSFPDKKKLAENPTSIVVFDAIKIENEVLIMKPYRYRYELLGRQIGTWQTPRLRYAMSYPGKELWDKVVKENREGVVIKNPNTMYDLGKRSKDCLKLKYYKFAEVKVEKKESNSAGTKIFGKFDFEGKSIIVETQLAGIYNVEIGDIRKIKYLDIIGDRLIQPTRVHA